MHIKKSNKSKSLVRKRRAQCVASLLLVPVICSSITTPANALHKWEGWTDENKEQAWTVFGVSQWNSTASDIIFSSDGSLSKADVPDSFRNAVVPDDDPEDPGKTYEEVVTEVLEDPIFKDTNTLSFPSSEYRELLLAIGYQLNKRGESWFSGNGLEKETVDVTFYGTYISTLKMDSVRMSFRYLMNRYASSEEAYRRAHCSTFDSDLFPDLYEMNGSMQAVIQGVVYGYYKSGRYAGYARASETYSEESAKEYYNNNKNKLSANLTDDFSDFATDVASMYTAVRSLGETTVKGW